MAKSTKDPKEIAQVGTISANGDTEIGAKLAEAMEKVGEEGVITVEESKTAETTLEVVEGMQFDRGYLSPYFVTDPERMEAAFEDAYLLVSEKKNLEMSDLLPLLEAIAKEQKPLVINRRRRGRPRRSPRWSSTSCAHAELRSRQSARLGDRRKDVLRDIAILTGAQTISDELGIKLENVTLADLGRAKRVTLDKDTTTIVTVLARKTRSKARIEAIARRSKTQQ